MLRRLLLGAAALQSRIALALQSAPPQVRVVRKQALPDGMEATIVEVTYAPGGQSAEHRHPGFVMGYVLEGRFRFAIEGQAERVLEAGQTFFEPAGVVHSTSANAQQDKPAKILAFMVAPAGRPVAEPK
jgi:quercetin dioxygenase-like cupin family protein